MKKMILLAVLAIMGLQAQAQIVSSRSSMITREVVDRGGWSTFGIEYLPSTMSNDGRSESFTGLALNYTNALSLTQSAPLFLEWGVGAQYSFYDKNNVSVKWVSAKAPVNLIYDVPLPNTNIHLDPFVGVKFRFNIWGEGKNSKASYNLFSSDGGDANRFQIGMQIGLKARFNNQFYAGVGYGFDFSDFGSNTKIQEIKIMAGLVF